MLKRLFFLLPAAQFVVGCTGSIHDAINRRDPALVAAMLREDESLARSRTRAGKTPLHYALTYRNDDAIDLLLNHGAEINASDQTGLTPLHVAAIHDRLDGCNRLLARGADLLARDDFGDTPLHLAALHGKTRMVERFISAGADAQARNNAGATALELAKKYRRQDVVDLLEGRKFLHE